MKYTTIFMQHTVYNIERKAKGTGIACFSLLYSLRYLQTAAIVRCLQNVPYLELTITKKKNLTSNDRTVELFHVSIVHDGSGAVVVSLLQKARIKHRRMKPF